MYDDENTNLFESFFPLYSASVNSYVRRNCTLVHMVAGKSFHRKRAKGVLSSVNLWVNVLRK